MPAPAIEIGRVIGKNIITENNMRKSKKYYIDKFIRAFNEIIPSKNGCIEWNKLRTEYGYGRFCLYGSYVLTHRYSYEIFNGEINGLHVCHSCDNPPCINPKHLFLGTPKENINDSSKKGRLHFGKNNGAYTRPDRKPVGDRNGSSKLNTKQVLEILDRVKGGELPSRIHKDYGISKPHAYQIANGKSWKHLTKKECFYCGYNYQDPKYCSVWGRTADEHEWI